MLFTNISLSTKEQTVFISQEEPRTCGFITLGTRDVLSYTPGEIKKGNHASRFLLRNKDGLRDCRLCDLDSREWTLEEQTCGTILHFLGANRYEYLRQLNESMVNMSNLGLQVILSSDSEHEWQRRRDGRVLIPRGQPTKILYAECLESYRKTRHTADVFIIQARVNDIFVVKYANGDEECFVANGLNITSLAGFQLKRMMQAVESGDFICLEIPKLY